MSLYDWSGVCLDMHTLHVLHQYHKSLLHLVSVFELLASQSGPSTLQGQFPLYRVNSPSLEQFPLLLFAQPSLMSREIMIDRSEGSAGQSWRRDVDQSTPADGAVVPWSWPAARALG